MSARRSLVILFLIALVLWFAGLDYRKLVRPDEGRYAEIPREMAATGDWITPRLDGFKYFEKPALQYWTTALAYLAFGEHQWSARLWSAVTGFLGILLVYYCGCRLYGPGAGLNAALILGSSGLYVLIGHINTLDMGATFFMSLGLAGFLLAQREGATPGENKLWMHVAWAALALAVLSKGLIGVVLPGATLILYTAIARDWNLWKRLHLATGAALFLALSAPWFAAVSIANPEFFNFFFVHEHLARFLTKVHGRYQPWWYFVPVLLGGILPWLVLMVDALLHAWKSAAVPAVFKPQRFLLLWVAFIFLFFSASDSKLPSYILPIFPALALLMGKRAQELGAKVFFWQVSPVALAALAALYLAPQAVDMASDEVPRNLYLNYVPWLTGAAALALAGGLIAMALGRRGRLQPGMTVLAFSALGCMQLIIAGHDSLAPANSAYAIAEKIRSYVTPDIPFYSVGMYEQTLPFYIKRSVTPVQHLDELEFGALEEPGRWLPTYAAFQQAWAKAPAALAIMSPETYRQFQDQGVPMEALAMDTRRVVVRKR